MELIAAAQAALCLLLAAVALLRQRVHPHSARILAIYSLISVLWLASQVFFTRGWLPFLLDEFTAHMPLYGLLLLAMSFFWLARHYVRYSGSAWTWGLVGIAWGGGLLLLDSNLVTHAPILWAGSGRVIYREDFIVAGLALGWCFFMGLAVLTIWSAYRTARQPLQRNRISYLSALVLPIFAGGATFLVAYWTLGSLLHTFGLLLTTFATLNPRLPSFRQAILRSLSYLITTGVALVFYLAVFMVARVSFLTFTGSNPWWVAALLAVLLAVLFSPLLWQVQRWLDRLIAGVSHDPRRILRQYSQTISNILDLGLLSKVVIDLIGQALDIRRGWLLTISHDTSLEGCHCYLLNPVTGADQPSPEKYQLPEDNPLAEYWRSPQALVTQGEIETITRFDSLSAEDRLWIESLQAELFVPIHSKEEWIGLLALGPKHSGEPFWDDDQFLLSTLADQTAVALENARLVESLVRLNNDFRRAITALDQANRTLERLDRAKAEFISVASHELRTPLALVTGYSQLLLEEPGLVNQPDNAKILAGIHSGAQRLHEIVESMLDMARIDARELQLDVQPILFEELIGGLQGELQGVLKERNQILELQDLDSLPPIQGDRELVRKVFYQLLNNAVKYTPDGGRITVSGRLVQSTPQVLADSGVELVVSDTGIGIDPSMQDVIFTKFYQTGELALHSSGKTKFKGGGPGLGLAIARGIVQAHFGRIWVESPGYDEIRCPGSRFYVFLPLHPPEKTRPPKHSQFFPELRNSF